jgi:hypothetical protein
MGRQASSANVFYNQCDMRDLMDYRQNWFPSRFVEIINNLPDECAE